MARFFVNEHSLHGQYASGPDLHAALRGVFKLQGELKTAGFNLEVSRRLADRPAAGGVNLRQALFAAGNRDITRLVLSWLDHHGPFWDQPPRHDPAEYFECGADLVTESGLAEAAMLLDLAEELAVDTISFTPSTFAHDPLRVAWRGHSAGDREFEIFNHVESRTLGPRLTVLQRPVKSWVEMLEVLRSRCPALLFSPEILEHLGTCFYPNVAKRCFVLLPALDQMVQARRNGDTKKFEELRSQWMVGEAPRITDASDTEKTDAQFARAMTFTHPATGRKIFCGWHGKIQTPCFRIHFEWPPPPDSTQSVFVAYIGPKLTKQ